MFQRVLDLSYECEEGIRREMRSFIMRWHSYEVSNLRRHAFYPNQVCLIFIRFPVYG